MVQLTDKIWAVEVPSASFVHFINGKGRLQFHKATNFDSVELPPGSWQYLFTTKGCSEEDARIVVSAQNAGYTDYDFSDIYCCIPYDTATQSLQSLLRSKGCDVNKNWAILLKQK